MGFNSVFKGLIRNSRIYPEKTFHRATKLQIRNQVVIQSTTRVIQSHTSQRKQEDTY